MRSIIVAGVDLATVWRRRWYILSAVSLTVVLGVAYLAMTNRLYEAETRVLVQPVGLSLDERRTERLDRQFTATQAEIVRSPLIVRQALERVPVTVPAGYENGPVFFVLESLSVVPVVQTDVLRLRYRSEDAEQAVAIVRAIIESYKEHLRASESSSHNETVELLSKREQELREELRALQAKHQELRKNSPLVGQGRENVSVQTTMLSQLAQRLAEIRVRKFELENNLQAMSLGVTTDLATRSDQAINAFGFREAAGIADPFGPSALDVDESVTLVSLTEEPPAQTRQLLETLILRSQSGVAADDIVQMGRELRQAQIRRNQIQQVNGPRHPDLRAASAEIAQLESLLDTRLRATAAALKQQLEVEAAAERNLTRLYDAEYANVKELDDYLVRDEIMRGEIQRTEQLYNGTLTQLTSVKLADQALANGKASVVVRELDGQDLRPALVWPQPTRFLALCGILGLLGGLVFACAPELTKRISEHGPSMTIAS